MNFNTLMGGGRLSPSFFNEISCAFSTDNNYAPYLGVAIKSLIDNSSKENNYGIYILEENLSNEYKLKLSSITNSENIKIKFINLSQIYKKYSEDIFYTRGHLTKAMYNRCFIPEIFKNFEKIMYFDCDLIFMKDISNLFNINLKNKCVGVVKDTGIYVYNDYCINILNLKDYSNYFNSGVMVFDLKTIKTESFSNEFIKILKQKNNILYFPDQDVLNIMLKDKIYFLDEKWNFQNGILSLYPDKINEKEYFTKDIYILHYTAIKPWNDSSLINAEKFFEISRKSTFYEEILYKSIDNKMKTLLNNLQSNHLKCYHPTGLKKLFSIQNAYFNGEKNKFITIFGFTFINKRILKF